jgi:ribonuclease BN (tRNA processing enzyme)
MKFVVLGSGSSVPHPKRSSSGYWIETGSGSILLDCSASTIQRMAQEGLDWSNLGAIWISHFHLDHCGGLFPFLFATKYAPETQVRTGGLRIIGPRGLRELIGNVDAANNYRLLTQPFPVEIVETGPLEEFEFLPGVGGVALDTPHTPESLAVSVTEKGRAVVYSSDTGFTETLASFASGADLFILECSFVRNKPVASHLELAEAEFLIRTARAKRSMLTHFYPEWDDVEFAETVGGTILEAIDGFTIDEI